MVEPFAETLEPRRESGIVGRPGPLFPVLAGAVAHAFDTRKTQGKSGFFPPTPEAARTILTGSGTVKNPEYPHKPLETNEQSPLRKAPPRPLWARRPRLAAAANGARVGARRNAMRMIAAVLLLGLAASMPPAAAQGVAEGGDNGRFSFKEVPDGLLRLDSRTGQVSLCSRISTAWACRMLADDRVALENEIGRLLDENAALKKDLEARANPPAVAPAPLSPSAPSPPNVLGAPNPQATPSPQTAPKRSERDLNLPSDVDLDRMMSFLEKMWRRLLDMAERTQREFDQGHPRKNMQNGI
jgi:hypothetical protein